MKFSYGNNNNDKTKTQPKKVLELECRRQREVQFIMVHYILYDGLNEKNRKLSVK